MTLEQKLLELEDRDPRVLLVPRLWTMTDKSVWPLSPTDVLTWYRTWGKPAYRTEDLAEMPDGALFFPPWGWCDVVEPVFIDATEEMGGTFHGTLAAARAICKADPWLMPCRVKKEYLLTAMLKRDVSVLLFTVAFWLRSRNNAFLAVMEEMEQKRREEAEGRRVPVFLAGDLTAPPDTPIQ